MQKWYTNPPTPTAQFSTIGTPVYLLTPPRQSLNKVYGTARESAREDADRLVTQKNKV